MATEGTSKKVGSKILKVMLLIAGFLTFVVLVLYAGQYIRTFFARQKVSQARAATEKTTDKKLVTQVQLLRQAGILGNKIASSKVDVCYVTHRDRGWFIDSWYQDCYIRYVEGFSTKFDINEVYQRILNLPDAESEFGPSETLDCHLFKKNYKPTIIFRPAYTPVNEILCMIPDPLRGPLSIKGPILLDDELSTKMYKHFDVNKVDNSQNQVFITFDEHYFHEELGCGVGIFCTNPRPKPATAD